MQETAERPARRGAWRRALCVLAVVLLGAACSDRGALSPPTLEPLLARVDGPWLRDAKGRVVLLRGANYVRGEMLGLDGHAPREEDFAFLASLGFNLVRMPVAWGSLEPRPNEYDLAFLRDQVDPLLRFASNHGMQVVLALQRAPSSSCLLGPDRAPSWTCARGRRTAPRTRVGSARGARGGARQPRAVRLLP